MPSVVLVRPEEPEHTGFIARLAHNFGFDLRIVKPNFNLSEARTTANRSQVKLREARIFDTVEDAVDTLNFVIGTKPGGVSLDDAEIEESHSVMIGPESCGLENNDLKKCDEVAEISTEDYSSLPQSHAAGIFMHHIVSQNLKK